MAAPETPKAVLVAGRALALAMCVATLATLLFVAANELVPREAPLSFAGAFLRYALPFYALLLAVPPLVAWGVARLLGAPGLPRAVTVVLAGAALFSALVLNGPTALRLLGLEGPPTFRVQPRSPWPWASSASRPVPRCGSSAGSPPSSSGCWLPSWPGPPSSPSLLERPASRRPRREQATDRAPRGLPPLVFVGVDGADWKLMAPLLERGELPTIAALRARGATGELGTFRPTHSPALWTTMVTGRSPKHHGIPGFTSLRMAGVAGALGRTHAPRALGFDWLYATLLREGRIREGPVVSSARRVPAFWEIATAHGSPVSVVNLWATWPAEPVLGALVSERIYSFRQAARAGDLPEEGQLTWPPELHAGDPAAGDGPAGRDLGGLATLHGRHPGGVRAHAARLRPREERGGRVQVPLLDVRDGASHRASPRGAQPPSGRRALRPPGALSNRGHRVPPRPGRLGAGGRPLVRHRGAAAQVRPGGERGL